MNTNQIFIALVALFAASVMILQGCEDSKSKEFHPAIAAPIAGQEPPAVLDGGRTILMNTAETDQITSTPAEERKISIELKAPARIVLSAIASSAGGAPVLMFESTDLSDAISDYLRAKTQLEKSTKEMERLRSLVEHEAAAGKDLLDAQADVEQFKATLAQSESKIRLSGLDLSSTLHLPPGKVILVADVPESQLRMVHSGGPARVIFNAYPNETFTGKITAIASVIDPVTRSVKVEVILSNTQGRLLAGMYGQIILGVDDETAVAIPISALFTAQGKSFVFVETQRSRFERREVEVGMQGNDWAEVLSGLVARERVVARGTMLLKGLSFGY